MSHMQYALSVWGPSLSQNQLLRLQQLQNRAVRLVFSLIRNDHISDYYQELHWLKVTQLIQFRLACVMFHQYHAARGTVHLTTPELHHILRILIEPGYLKLRSMLDIKVL